MVRYRIMTGKYRRYQGDAWWRRWLDVRTWVLNLIDAVKFTIGCLQSLWLLGRLRPDRVFIKGGYVGLPVGIAAWLWRVPLIIHESDSVPGLTNRVLSRLTPYRLSGFAIPGFIALGNPVRERIMRPLIPDRSRFGIAGDRPVVLVMGGSQGSHAINRVIDTFIQHYTDVDIIHVYGNDPVPLAEYSHYHPFQFLDEDMPQALQLADVVVARAGANTLAELAVLGKPSIIIPHPNLSGGHQIRNARQWKGSISVIEQDRLDAHSLHKEITRLLEDEEYRQRLTEAITMRGRPQAAADIAAFIRNPYEAAES